MHTTINGPVAKTRGKFALATSRGETVIYRRESDYPNGKAALIEVTSPLRTEQQVVEFRNGKPVAMSATIGAAAARKLDAGLRVLVVVSYDRVIGLVTERSGETTLILDPTKYHLHPNQTHEHISLLRSAVTTVDDSLSVSVVNSRRRTSVPVQRRVA